MPAPDRRRHRALALAAALAVAGSCAAPVEGEDSGADAAPDARDAVPDRDTDADDVAVDGVTPGDDARDDARPDAPAPGPEYERSYTYTLASQAFPDSGHPGVLVHVPDGFDPGAGSIDAVVYVHGFRNCVANAAESVNSPCTPGGPARNAYALIDQFDAARVRAILVLPEVRFDEASGDAGQLGRAGGFRAFMEELLAAALAPVLGARSVADLGRVVVMAHSGGYAAAAAIATLGDVPQVREVDLLDALYGSTASFDRFVTTNLAGFGDGALSGGSYRFGDVYTDSGGTAANSVAMARRVSSWLTPAGDPARFLWDDTHGTLVPAAFLTPFIFKRSALAHDAVPRYYFGRIVAASGFAPLP